MTVHNKMFDKSAHSKKKEEQTYHRIYVEFEGGYFINLGVIDSEFQQMVKHRGGPNIVKFCDTTEKWVTDEDGYYPISGVNNA